MASIITGLQGQPPQLHPKGYPFVAGRYGEVINGYISFHIFVVAKYTVSHLDLVIKKFLFAWFQNIKSN